MSQVSTPSFLMGLTFGLVISVLIATLGNRHLKIDEDFLKTFPDIEKVFPNTRFEFPDRLETTDPDLVGSNRNENSERILNTQGESESSPVDSLGDNSEFATLPGNEGAQQSIEEEDPNVTGYVLQAGAFSERRHAEAFRASLLLEGYDAFTTEHPDENALARFRVIVGPYPTKQASNEDVSRLRQRNVSAFLVPITENSP